MAAFSFPFCLVPAPLAAIRQKIDCQPAPRSSVSFLPVWRSRQFLDTTFYGMARFGRPTGPRRSGRRFRGWRKCSPCVVCDPAKRAAFRRGGLRPPVFPWLKLRGSPEVSPKKPFPRAFVVVRPGFSPACSRVFCLLLLPTSYFPLPVSSFRIHNPVCPTQLR
jgi:hypothetical protein